MKSVSTPRQAMEKISFFSSMSETHMAELAAYCTVCQRKKGDSIFFEGDEAKGFYFVVTGKVKIYRMTPDGREAILHLFGPGEPFGEAAVFQGRSFPANAQCITAGSTLFLPRPALLECMRKDQALVLELLTALCLRLHSFANKVEELTLMETPQRLAAYLLHQSTTLDNAAEFTLDISKSLLASMLGTARETLSRALSRFVDDGAIAMTGRTVRILDAQYLEALVQRLDRV